MLTPKQTAWADEHVGQHAVARVEGTIVGYAEHPDGQVRFRVDGPDTVAVFAQLPPADVDQAELDEQTAAEAQRKAEVDAEEFRAAVADEVERVLAARS